MAYTNASSRLAKFVRIAISVAEIRRIGKWIALASAGNAQTRAPGNVW